VIEMVLSTAAAVEVLALALELLAVDDLDALVLGCVVVAGLLVAAGAVGEVSGSFALVSPLGFRKSA
jgi:hypothetical protein